MISKHKNSQPSENRKVEILNSIKDIMSSRKPYLDSSINIDKLAKSIDTNRQYLSIVINEYFNKNFSNFINEYRIEEAIKLMKSDEKMKYTIEGISKNVGFNNRTSFIKSFKQVTGKTPSEYRNKK